MNKRTFEILADMEQVVYDTFPDIERMRQLTQQLRSEGTEEAIAIAEVIDPLCEYCERCERLPS